MQNRSISYQKKTKSQLIEITHVENSCESQYCQHEVNSLNELQGKVSESDGTIINSHCDSSNIIPDIINAALREAHTSFHVVVRNVLHGFQYVYQDVSLKNSSTVQCYVVFVLFNYKEAADALQHIENLWSKCEEV
ncbi:hypothetical protein GJ496_006863 [Pomphorhynchus laevis]|nr:hypothetical protein GJ496_006863 [Pomphorhynchus laevis]